MNQEAKVLNEQSAAQHLAQMASHKGAARAGWICLAIGVVAAFIPLFGWFVVGPMMLVSLVLGIVVMVRGATGQGIAIILCAMLVLPILTVAIAGAAFVGMAGGM